MDPLSPSVTGIRGRVLRRGQEGYEHLRRGAVWHAGVPERYPEIIVFASSADDVAAAVGLARSEGLTVAIRSGGHSWSGSHLRDGSLLIDLSNLRDVQIEPESMTAVVQPGLRGSELLGMLRAHGLFFPVGHNYGVGIGGYLLQGGFGWAGREYGPACGSVIGIDVVTADGRLVHASETENPELLWAARGAGPGFFGGVTAFHLRLYPHRPVTMRSSYIFPGALAEEACAFLHEVGAGTRTEMGLLIQRHEIADFEPVVVLGAIAYSESDEEAREQLAFMEACPLRDRALSIELYRPTVHGEQELDESTSVLNEERRWIADNIATSADFEQLRPGLADVVATLPAAPSYLLVFNWDGHPAAASRPPMAFSLEGEFCYALYTAWDSSERDDEHREWTTARLRTWEPHSWGTMLADENLLNRPSRFVSDSALERLDAVRAEWDPENAFVSWLGRPESRRL